VPSNPGTARPERAGLSRTHENRRLVRDWLLYISIGIVVVLAAVGIAVFEARNNIEPGLPLKWLGFIGASAIIFAYSLRSSREIWNRAYFWPVFVVILSLHAGIGVLLLSRLSRVPLVFFAFLPPIELPLIQASLRKLVATSSKK
jgi:hypothetical protein